MTLDTLSREQIVQAAIEILDADGTDGLSMRRLGTRLGSGATSIYWYVKNKDELLELAADEVFTEIGLPDPDELGWRAAATVMSVSLRAMILRHPWLPMVTATYPTGGRNIARYQDHSFRVYEAAGFTSDDADWAITAVFSYVVGCSAGDAMWQAHLRQTGVNEEQHIAQVIADARKAAEGFPRLLARYEAIESEVGLDVRKHLERAFDFGLRAVLDGVAAQLPTGMPGTTRSGR